MSCSENCKFGDKEQMADLLASEKYLAATYSSFLSEAATPEVVQCMSELLRDTHTAGKQLFDEMNTRGWYPVTKAQENKLENERAKFAAQISG